MLIPMVLAHRDRAWIMAAVCTVASVIGGIFGYLIGYFLYEAIGPPDRRLLRLSKRLRPIHRRLQPMGVVDHPDQGSDANSL
jgi:membrane protein YqaA with SNARE-associated domain